MKEIGYPRVSVVITTHESRKQEVLRNIGSLIKGEYKNIEIILIDNASTDNTQAAVRKNFPRVKIIKNTTNRGATGGKNQGIRSSSKNSKYILFLDSDFVADKRGLFELVKAIEGKNEYGGATPKILLQSDRSHVQYAGSRVGLITSLNYSNSGPDGERFNKKIVTENAGGSVLIKEEVVREVGFFDESFFPVYYEDADYSYRVKEAGYKILYVPTSHFYHKAPFQDTNAWLDHAYLTARNKIIFMKKHSVSFPLFLIIYPIFPLFYLWTAVKHRRIDAIIGYAKGVLDGLKYCFRAYKA